MKWSTGTRLAVVSALLFSATAPAATVVYTFTGGGAINPSGITPVTLVVYTGWNVENSTSFAGLNPVNVLDNNVGSGYQLTAPLAGNGVDISSYAPFDATYSGSITVVNGVATSGTLSWTGELGFEPSIAPGDTPGTGLYTVLLLNGSWNLGSGALAGTTVVACRAKPGLAGAACIGPYNTALSNYDMPLGVVSFVDNGNGTVTFTLGSDDFSNAGGVHNFDPSLGSPDFNHRVTFTLDVATVSDADGDGIPDASDNCRLVANPTQVDSDQDGYGNRCDGDLNNNNVTNSQDYVLFRAQLGAPSVAPLYNKADINANGVVNSQDYVLFRGLLGSPPGPSGLACAGTVPCPP